MNLRDIERWMDAREPQPPQMNCFESGVILALCLVGMAAIILLSIVF